MKKMKYEILFVVLLMTIGIAAVSTNVIINGATPIASNPDDFNVYFSNVLVNGVKDLSLVKNENTLEFNSEFSAVGDEIEVIYDITNASLNYDADINVACTQSTTYLSIDNYFDTDSYLSARSTKSGVLTVSLSKSYTGADLTQDISCTISASAVERTSQGSADVVGPLKLISFTYEGIEYSAVDGMTWGDFINSDFNTVGFYVATTYVLNSSNYISGPNPGFVLNSDLIIDGADYENAGICCFDAGSKVLMADGTTKNIEDVEVGDLVMSLNEETGEFEAQIVKETIVKENSDDLVYVNLSNGKRIGMRAYHPLLTTEGWKSLRPNLAETIIDVGDVQVLEVGDTLVGYEENVTIVSIEQREDIENYNTYNLSVENTHNYIVEGVVVHNASCSTG